MYFYLKKSMVSINCFPPYPVGHVSPNRGSPLCMAAETWIICTYNVRITQ